jgi:imidazole glycerol-phosphate synthase subunit HisH
MSEPGKSVVVFDYGFGDVRSAEQALTGAGARVAVTRDYDAAMAADGVVVPGSGAFDACLTALRRARGHWVVGRRLAGGRPVLAICVGMQLLFARAVEHGAQREGLGEWPGTVAPLKDDALPHEGWDAVEAPAGSRLFADVPEGERFYFGHSHAVRDWELEPPSSSSPFTAPKVAWSAHGERERFVAAVENGPLWATQFHPEKSGEAGARLLTNWIETL